MGTLDGKRVAFLATDGRGDLTNAGASWVDEQCHLDRGLVTSRHPGNLPAFCAALVDQFADGAHTGQPVSEVTTKCSTTR